MATHPPTQQPPSSLTFPSGPRAHALGFGFSFGSSSSRHPAPSSSHPLGQSSMGISSVLTPQPRPSVSHFSAPRPIASSSKRRRSSVSSSPPSSPTSTHSASPATKYRLQRKGPLKRIREDHVGAGQDASIDVGVLLAALPQSSHLQILLNLLETDPSLQSRVLSCTPAPELSQCTMELDRLMDKIIRQLGASHVGRALLYWTRVEEEIVQFCRASLTYLTFFHNPPQKSLPPDAHITHNLLFAITSHIASLLQYSPPSVPDSLATNLLNQLANSVISRWSEWVATVSENVNGRGEMYPHSVVETWNRNLIALGESTSKYGGSSINQPLPSSSFLRSFQSALEPTRVNFQRQVGWLLGPRGGT